MLRYVVRRLLLLVPILLGVSLLIFFWIRALPGNPAQALLGERATPQLIKEYRERYGFNNSQITGILNRALNEPNFKKRVALYKRANEIIMKYLPGVPYAHATPALGAEKRIQKLIATPVGGVWFQYATLGGQ